MEIKFDNNIPIYIQILEHIKVAIISGEYQKGERLPSVRELSIIYKVNPNTIQKSLQDLENQGLIYTERTNGKYVTTNQELIIKLKNMYAKNLTDEYLRKMQKICFDEYETLEFIKKGNCKNGIN